MVDEITQAVLSRDDIARYLQDGDGGHAARERIHAYLEELRTTQRYSIYRALKHPLYPILRKIERIGENVDNVKAAVDAGAKATGKVGELVSSHIIARPHEDLLKTFESEIAPAKK